MRWTFLKMQALGNDFVVVDARGSDRRLAGEQARALADRHFGVGCDQVLELSTPGLAGAAARYRVFNADGSSAEHCGNGVRCVARYLARTQSATVGAANGHMTIELENGQAAEVELLAGELVRVSMGEPDFAPASIPLDVADQADYYEAALPAATVRFAAVSTGNPHAVIEVADTGAAAVGDIGPALQALPLFPRQANVGFVEVVNDQHLRLRVYERGAGETLACGTGACAAAVVMIRDGRARSPVTVQLPGGELEIAWDGPGSEIFMTGPGQFVFEGEIEL
ncbi:MAG: diaminopimelate epimerase [Gammaproteobacteria bacterium]|nr:diaminopimelate epimerase [Gammaproteobacteria bacterium]NNM00334.1 diaminopimelate epimerase [Gammaproteobacteria bacterium]